MSPLKKKAALCSLAAFACMAIWYSVRPEQQNEVAPLAKAPPADESVDPGDIRIVDVEVAIVEEGTEEPEPEPLENKTDHFPREDKTVLRPVVPLPAIAGLDEFLTERLVMVNEVETLLKRTATLSAKEREGQIKEWREKNSQRLKTNREKAVLYAERSIDEYPMLVVLRDTGATANRAGISADSR